MSSVIRLADDTGELPAVGGSYRIRLSGADTDGRLAVVEHRLVAGALGASPHVHHAHEEDFVVLEGELTFDLVEDGQPRAEVVGAGGSVVVPRGTTHDFRNASGQPARCLFLLTPAGYEDYFREVSRMVSAGHEPTAADLAELRLQFHTTAG